MNFPVRGSRFTPTSDFFSKKVTEIEIFFVLLSSMLVRVEQSEQGQRIFHEEKNSAGLVQWAVIVHTDRAHRVISIQLNSSEVGIAMWHRDFGLAQASLWHVETTSLPLEIGDQHKTMVAQMVLAKILPQVNQGELRTAIEAFTSAPFEPCIYQGKPAQEAA